MFRYEPGDDVGALEPWPFDIPASHYRIREGRPEASGRLEVGGPGHRGRFGIWRCTPGIFDCTEQGDELMTVLSGRCRITDHATGVTADLGPGDTLFLRDGSRVTWDIAQEVTKVFFGQKSDGY